jgi:hypothetical protein
MSDLPHVECQLHGLQDSALVVRYDDRAGPSYVPDRYKCICCALEDRPADAANSVKIAPESTGL